MKRLIVFLLTFCTILAAAVPAPAIDPNAVSPGVCFGSSPWAEAEIAEAAELGLIPADLACEWQSGITRAEFAKAAVFFLGLQFRLDAGRLLQEFETCGGTVDPEPFSDTQDFYVTTAYHFGVIAGRGNGVFDPDSLITREEAAKILCGAHLACAAHKADEPDGDREKQVPDQTGTARRFSDHGEISEWAAESVTAVSQWGVMNGVSEKVFSPKGTYTREQCFVTFLRLWKNAPYSRFRGNVKPLRTYDQVMEELASLYEYRETARLETDGWTLLAWYQQTGRPGSEHIRIVYRDGGWSDLTDQLPDKSLYNRRMPRNYRLAEDGNVAFDWETDDGGTIGYILDPDTARISREDIAEPAELLGMTVQEIRNRWGTLTLEYSEHGPGAPVYSMEKLRGVKVQFAGHMMDEPLPEDAVPSTVLLNADYGTGWGGFTVGRDLSTYPTTRWDQIWFSASSGTASLCRVTGGLTLCCVTADPDPYFEEDWMDYDAWKAQFSAMPSGTILQIRISRNSGEE